MYQDKHEYNVIKGVIPDFGYDVKFAVVVDGKEQNEIPTTALGKNNKYYSVDVKCPSSKTEGLWDYNAWKLNLDYIESNSKCNLTFTSNLTKEEYDEYIKSGIEYRRNTYRGKNITDLKTSGELYNQIGNCTFDDIYVGDYILSDKTDSKGNKIKWLIADLNNYLHTGDKYINATNGYKNKSGSGLKACHATIIPADSLETASMNINDTTEGGYYNSNMVQSILGTNLILGENTILSKYIYPDFSTHIIKYQNLLSNAMDSTLSNQFGTNGGATSGWEWYDRYLDLMSEVNIYGSIVWSSSGYDIGIDNEQYAIFKLRPELKYTDGNDNGYTYWLKTVTYSTSFAGVDRPGSAGVNGASGLRGIRPRFLID